MDGRRGRPHGPGLLGQRTGPREFSLGLGVVRPAARTRSGADRAATGHRASPGRRPGRSLGGAFRGPRRIDRGARPRGRGPAARLPWEWAWAWFSHLSRAPQIRIVPSGFAEVTRKFASSTLIVSLITLVSRLARATTPSPRGCLLDGEARRLRRLTASRLLSLSN